MQEVVMVQDVLDKGSCDEFRNCSTYGWCFKIILPRHKQKAGHPNDISNESDCTTLSQLPFTRIGGPLTSKVLYAAWLWSVSLLLLIFRPLIAADYSSTRGSGPSDWTCLQGGRWPKHRCLSSTGIVQQCKRISTLTSCVVHR